MLAELGRAAWVATMPAPAPASEGKDLGDYIVYVFDHLPKVVETMAYVLALVAVVVILWAGIRRGRHASLVVRAFVDGAIEPKIGAGVAALVEERLVGTLRRKDRIQTGYDLDRVITDVELLAEDNNLAKAMGRLADVSQLQLVVGVLDLVERLIPSRGMAAAGELLPAGKEGAGISLALFEGNRLTARSALWEKEVETWFRPGGFGRARPLSAGKAGATAPPSPAPPAPSPAPPTPPSPYYKLASPAAWWVQYEASRVLNGNASNITNSAPSFALVGHGLARERQEDNAGAADAYASALSHDPDNVAALINLARLLTHRHQAYAPAALLLIRARNALARQPSGDDW